MELHINILSFIFLCHLSLCAGRRLVRESQQRFVPVVPYMNYGHITDKQTTVKGKFGFIPTDPMKTPFTLGGEIGIFEPNKFGWGLSGGPQYVDANDYFADGSPKDPALQTVGRYLSPDGRGIGVQPMGAQYSLTPPPVASLMPRQQMPNAQHTDKVNPNDVLGFPTLNHNPYNLDTISSNPFM